MQDDSSQKYVAAKHYFGGNADAYDERRDQKPKWNEENRLVESYVAKLPRGASLIDVPFGTGRFAPAYLNAGLRVAGADISADMIAQAKRRFGSKIADFDLRTAAAEALPYGEQSFDYLICNRFIKWLPSESIVEAVAKEFRRVCRGEMLIQVKVRESKIESAAAFWRPIARLFKMDDSRRPTARYSLRQLEHVFVRDGWALTEVVDASKVGRGVKYLILRKS